MNTDSDKNLSMEIERCALDLTQAAAIACYDWIGRGREEEADLAAVDAMRKLLHSAKISGTIVIGEGERDKAPMLFIGEKVGIGGEIVDIAVDPLEGTTICAHGRPDSISVLAIALEGGMLHAPDVYMNKIAIGLKSDLVVDLDNTPKQNTTNLANAKGCSISEITVCILDRPRHHKMISEIYEIGAKVKLIGDGDISAVIAVTQPNSGVDIYMGIGGAPEGVLAAAALSSMGGFMQGRLMFNTDIEKERAYNAGINDLDYKYGIGDMVRGDVIFSATGITDGWMLKGVKRFSNEWRLNSLIINKNRKSLTYIETHKLDDIF
jgi:fructose-1,6-bisphosphatase II / sedoheptulose-1,7-bisphosphatase